ncbi:hypothetical protein GCM10010353_37820 [Streptomyces chryseus]|uniref:Uncharacterized protein n=1 Tax=Streptomyces chryseus TaxID=68186 RepID=A0ABQ3DJ80_9ACTN|nr:hypothetical protein GCM10010353_37820 [Streptomyces chryseus]GHA96139.1 hypothetical protein GCM10010346_18560 [Streptomyces chryseus]
MKHTPFRPCRPHRPLPRRTAADRLSSLLPGNGGRTPWHGGESGAAGRRHRARPRRISARDRPGPQRAVTRADFGGRYEEPLREFAGRYRRARTPDPDPCVEGTIPGT